MRRRRTRSYGFRLGAAMVTTGGRAGGGGRRHCLGRWINVDDKVRVKGFREEETHHE
jgi:hypothetical protein